jgi:TRAP-type C4-dicarboxylate transport system substrate-binding protein
MNRWIGAVALLIFLNLLMLGVAPVLGAPVTVRLATLAPDGSAWHNVLKDMSHEWNERTDGRVRVRIYPGGVAGDDPDMVRKLRIGQLQAGAITSAGLTDIDPAFNVFSIPLFFDSFEEFFYVLDKMTPTLKSRLEAKGFVPLNWAHAGWIHLFSKEPVRTVADLKRVKMFTWAGDDDMGRLWKSEGFRPVPLASTDILVGLQTGMIDGIPATPYPALLSQWYRHTPYMLKPGVGPLMGGTVMSMKTWTKISEDDRASLLEAAARAGERLRSEIPEKDLSAVREMEKRGLTVIDALAGEQSEQWRETAVAFASRVRESLVPEEIFEMASRYRDEFRRTHTEEGTR